MPNPKSERAYLAPYDEGSAQLFFLASIQARTSYPRAGRGAVTVCYPKPGDGPVVDYHPLERIPAHDVNGRPIRELVRQYDPRREGVIVIIKPDDACYGFFLLSPSLIEAEAKQN